MNIKIVLIQFLLLTFFSFSTVFAYEEMIDNFDEAIKACKFLGVGAQSSEKDIIKNYRGRWGG